MPDDTTPAVSPDIQGAPDQDPTVDQSAPQPDATPAPAPAPDESIPAPGPTTAPGQPGTESPAPAPAPAPAQPTGWRGVLVGALKGLATGGLPGAAEGAINPKQAAQQYANRQTIRNSRATVANAAGQSAMQEVAFAKDNHQLAMAIGQLNLHHLASQYDSHSPEFQQRLLDEDAGMGRTLQNNGVPVDQHFDNEDDANKYLQTRMQTDTDSPMSYVRHSDGKGGWNIYKVPQPDKLITSPVEVTIGIGANGEPLKVNYPANTLSWGRFYAIQSAAMQDQSKAAQQAQKNTGAQKVQELKGKTAETVANTRAAATVEAAKIRGATSPLSFQMMEGQDAQGNPVAGTARELSAAGIDNFNKQTPQSQNQTVTARELTAPNGLFARAAAQISDLDKKGKLGPIATRWNDFWAGKGLDGDQQAFRQTLDFISAKMMQAHLNRTNVSALEHFAKLVPPGSGADDLRKELKNEYEYARSVAKRVKPVKK